MALPRRDDGYDVSDYYTVDPQFGTLGDFVEFSHQAESLGIRVIVDLVVNHTSNEHPWFQAARSDPNSKYRDYYVWSEQRPDDITSGIVFPGYQKSTWSFDKKAGLWYYHRFYDFQPDLNFGNPEVQEEIHKIMGFWLQMGVSGFRVDAVPFLIELKGPNQKEGAKDYEYLESFRQFLNWRARDAIVMGEANVALDELSKYFGDGDRMQMLLSFMANQHLFNSLAKEDATPLMRALNSIPKLPAICQWGTFLRNHDEIDLGRLTEAERRHAFEKFGPDPSMQLYGRGIRRRLAPMLDNDHAPHRAHVQSPLHTAGNARAPVRRGDRNGGRSLTTATKRYQDADAVVHGSERRLLHGSGQQPGTTGHQRRRIQL